eukprot:2722465-Prymnesium_polylepis.1
MRLLGDDTACPTSRNSWLEYSPRLGPHSSVRLHPRAKRLTSALCLLPSQDDVLLSIILFATQSHPLLFVGPLASKAG